MKRKYPFIFFVFGVFQNVVRYFLIGLIGIVILIIGIVGVPICKTMGLIIIILYPLLCNIEQLYIRSASLKENDNHEFNQFMDTAFGINNDENLLSSHGRIMKIVEDEIKLQDADMDD